MAKDTQSKRYQFNKQDGAQVLEVFLWASGASIIAVLIGIVAEVDAGAYAVLIPAVNTFLYSAKKFFEEKGGLNINLKFKK